jgi:chromosome segregation ATPase
MGKRATNKEAKSPKKAKVARAQETPVLTAIDALSIPTSAREMLKVALPYCLTDREKHPFQAELLDSMQSLFQGVDQEKVAKLSDAEAKLQAAKTEKEKHVADIDAKRKDIASKKEVCDEKGKVVDEATDAVELAKKGLEEAKSKAEEFDVRKRSLETEQQSFEKLMKESWPPLKDGTFASNEWRKRNKSISELRQSLTATVKMEESLLDALEVTFKIKVDERDAFAKLSIEYAEDAFKNYCERVSRDILALAEEGASHKQAIEVAMTTLQEKEKAKELAEGEFETEQNLWVDLENSAVAATEALRKLDMSIEEADDELTSSKDELKEFRDMNSFFAKLIDPPAVEPEPVAEGAAEPQPAVEEVAIVAEAG